MSKEKDIPWPELIAVASQMRELLLRAIFTEGGDWSEFNAEALRLVNASRKPGEEELK